MKTIEQKVREGKVYERIEAERAKLRMLAGSKLDLPLNINYPVENLPQGAQESNYGKTRDIVAKKLNIGSGRTYEKAKKVVETIDTLKADGKIEKAADLSATLKASVDSAYNLLRREEKLQAVEKACVNLSNTPPLQDLLIFTLRQTSTTLFTQTQRGSTLTKVIIAQAFIIALCQSRIYAHCQLKIL